MTGANHAPTPAVNARSATGDTPVRRAVASDAGGDARPWKTFTLAPGATVEMPERAERNVDGSFWVYPEEAKGALIARCEPSAEPMKLLREIRGDHLAEVGLGPVRILSETAIEQDGYPGLRLYLEEGAPARDDRVHHLLVAGPELVCHLISFVTSEHPQAAVTDRFFDSLRVH